VSKRKGLSQSEVTGGHVPECARRKECDARGIECERLIESERLHEREREKTRGRECEIFSFREGV